MRTRLCPLFVLTFALAACGGSGSSGFDVAPGLESTLIDRAIAENRCVEGDGLLICPSGVPAPGPGDGMNVPGPSEVRVEAGLAGEVDCSTGGTCTLPVTVSTDGLPEGAQVRVAVRASDADVWQIGEPIEAQSSSGGDGTTPVDVELAGESAPGSEAQVAVLVFLPPIGVVPTQVQELRETGASYAFVVAPVSLSPGASF